MATLCDTSVLTGQEGTIKFRPPGTSVCIRDHVPFGELGNERITVPCNADFRVGDLVTFTEESGGNLDSALDNSVAPLTFETGTITNLGQFINGSGYTASSSFVSCGLIANEGQADQNATARATITTNASGEVDSVLLTNGGSGYSVGDILEADATLAGGGTGFRIEVDAVFAAGTGVIAYQVSAAGEVSGDKYIEVRTSVGAASAITLAQDGGTGTEDNALPAHINVNLADYLSVCGVRDFSIDISRDTLDITTLPCIDPDVDNSGCSKLAEFRKTQSGFASATGSMTVYFTCDQENISNRLIGSALLKSQAGARVKLYVCAKEENGVIDDATSLFIEADISITGASFSVNPDDPTSAELTFEVQKMHEVFGMTA